MILRAPDAKGRLLPALLFFSWLAGCAGIPDAARRIPDAVQSVELAGTPFYPQERYQCGPAALTTVLNASGADVDLDDIVDKVYIPGRQGSLAIELVAATRTSGRLPYPLEPTFAAVLAELDAGRPVLVLQNLGVSMIPRWHYAVVVGFDTASDRVILRSGVDKRRLTPTDVFLRTWSRGDFWALAVLEPGELPAEPDRHRYFRAVAGLEDVGRPVLAAAAWGAALERWPGDPVALFGRANSLLAADDFVAAEQAYRELLATRPETAAARNNLALALAHQGRYDEALREIRTAIDSNDDDALATELDGTLRDIERMLQKTRD